MNNSKLILFLGCLVAFTVAPLATAAPRSSGGGHGRMASHAGMIGRRGMVGHAGMIGRRGTVGHAGMIGRRGTVGHTGTIGRRGTGFQGGRTWNGRTWNGGTWSGGNWNGSLTNWNGRWGWWNGGSWWFPTSNVVFIGGFGFPWWWGWGWGPWSWGWSGYPYGSYGYGYQYGYYGGYYGPYGYGNPSYGYGNGYRSGHGNAGQYSSATRSRVTELQQRLTRAGYYNGPIDGTLGPQTQQAIRAYMEDHGYTSSSASPNQTNGH